MAASIVEKLQKLISHEKSARKIGSIAEAETFAAKIQTLLTEHKLTMTEVEFQAQDAIDPIGHERIQGRGRFMPAWTRYLIRAVANNFFCKVLSIQGADSFIFIGRASDRTAAVDMYRYLSGIAKKLRTEEMRRAKTTGKFEEELRREYGYCYVVSDKMAFTRTWNNSFLIGYSVAILKRMTETRTNLDAKATDQATGMILRDSASIDIYAKEQFAAKPGRKRKTPTIHPGALALGQKHGSEVRLTQHAGLGAGA